jgi:hypothetical protein
MLAPGTIKWLLLGALVSFLDSQRASKSSAVIAPGLELLARLLFANTAR